MTDFFMHSRIYELFPTVLSFLSRSLVKFNNFSISKLLRMTILEDEMRRTSVVLPSRKLNRETVF